MSHKRLYGKANNRLFEFQKIYPRVQKGFVQFSNGIQNIMSKIFKHYKLITKGRLAVRYAKTIHKSLTPRNGRRLPSLEKKHDTLEKDLVVVVV